MEAEGAVAAAIATLRASPAPTAETRPAVRRRAPLPNGVSRKELAAIRKMVKADDLDSVCAGLALMDALDNPELWALFAHGVWLSPDGRVRLVKGCEIDKRVRREHQTMLALWALRRSGKLDSCVRLDPSPYSSNGYWADVDEELADVSALSGLTNLACLCLARCDKLTDIGGLSGLTTLTELDLNGCKSLTDISALSGLTNLTHLDLGGNRSVHLPDLSALSGLTNLTDLRIGAVAPSVTNLSALSRLTRLTRLHLYMFEGLRDLKGLSGLTALTELHISVCKNLTDIRALSGLPNLTRLRLYNCTSLTDLTPLASLPSLEVLSIDLSNTSKRFEDSLALVRAPKPQLLPRA